MGKVSSRETEILNVLKKQQKLSMSEIVAYFGISDSTARRLCVSLEKKVGSSAASEVSTALRTRRVSRANTSTISSKARTPSRRTRSGPTRASSWKATTSSLSPAGRR